MVVTVKQEDNAFTLASSYGTVTEEILNQTTEISIIYGNFYTAPYRFTSCLSNILFKKNIPNILFQGKIFFYIVI